MAEIIPLERSEMLRDLQTRIRAGEQQAADFLYAYMRRRLRPLLERGARSEWEDLLHDCISAILEAIRQNRIEHPEYLIPYAYTIANRILWKWQRETVQALPYDESEDASEGKQMGEKLELSRRLSRPATQLSNLVDIGEHRARVRKINGMLRVLPSTDRKIVVDFYLRGRAAEDIRAELGVTMPGFKNRKTRALHRMARSREAA